MKLPWRCPLPDRESEAHPDNADTLAMTLFKLDEFGVESADFLQDGRPVGAALLAQLFVEFLDSLFQGNAWIVHVGIVRKLASA